MFPFTVYSGFRGCTLLEHGAQGFKIWGFWALGFGGLGSWTWAGVQVWGVRVWGLGFRLGVPFLFTPTDLYRPSKT